MVLRPGSPYAHTPPAPTVPAAPGRLRIGAHYAWTASAATDYGTLGRTPPDLIDPPKAVAASLDGDDALAASGLLAQCRTTGQHPRTHDPRNPTPRHRPNSQIHTTPPHEFSTCRTTAQRPHRPTTNDPQQPHRDDTTVVDTGAAASRTH